MNNQERELDSLPSHKYITTETMRTGRNGQPEWVTTQECYTLTRTLFGKVYKCMNPAKRSLFSSQ